jgi:sulfite exporter TauE/SafE
LSDLEPLHWTMIFLASLAGSLHCAAMCGGLSLAAGGGRLSSQWAYHLSRGSVYMLLGAWAGASGKAWITGWEWRPFQWVSIMLIIGTLIGVRFFGGRIASSLARRGFRNKSAILVGVASVLLPCGWLYSYVLLAGASGSWLLGASMMAAFWLGTLPALLGSRILLQGVLAKLGLRGQRVASLLFILAATQSLVLHWRHSNPDPDSSKTHLICGAASTRQDGTDRKNQPQ